MGSRDMADGESYAEVRAGGAQEDHAGGVDELMPPLSGIIFAAVLLYCAVLLGLTVAMVLRQRSCVPDDTAYNEKRLERVLAPFNRWIPRIVMVNTAFLLLYG